MDVARVSIVGGGVIGLWTLYNLTKQGIKTTLFEQFPYPHSRGSSHGQSRFGHHFIEGREDVRMIAKAFDMWNQFQAECGVEIVEKVGVLKVFDMHEKKGSIDFHQCLEHTEHNAPAFDIIPGEEIQAHFPGLKIDSKHKALYDKNGIMLKPEIILEALRKLCKENGGQILEDEEVLSVTPIDDNKVEIKTNKSTYFSRSAVLACGAYTNKFLRGLGLELPLKVMKANVYYWRDKSQSMCYSLANNFPAIIYPSYYSAPSYEYPGLVKLCHNAIITLDMEKENQSNTDVVEEKRLDEFKAEISEQFCDIDVDGPEITERCMFTRTPDWGFIIDYHPRHRNIVIGAGFSGHGFHPSPVVGKILGQMSLSQEPTYPIEPFSIQRFHEST